MIGKFEYSGTYESSHGGTEMIQRSESCSRAGEQRLSAGSRTKKTKMRTCWKKEQNRTIQPLL